jgi:hypothetical protein
VTQLELLVSAFHLSRVRSTLAAPILAFCRARVGGEFHMAELVAAIGAHASPDSPSRILRDLRQRGEVEYVVVSRAASLYRVVRVEA